MNQEPNSLFYLTSALACLAGLFFTQALRHVLKVSPKHMVQFLSTRPYFWRIYFPFCKTAELSFLTFILAVSFIFLSTLYVLFFAAATFPFFPPTTLLQTLSLIIFFILLVSLFFLFADAIPRSLAFFFPRNFLQFTAPPASFFLILLSPVIASICGIIHLIYPKTQFAPYSLPKELLSDFMEALGPLSDNDKRLFQSIFHFKNRIAREIMRPRVGLFCIPEEVTLQQAAEMLQREGYSRVPVFHDTLDTIVGVLFYKDVLSKYLAATRAGPDRERLLAVPVKTLMKKVFYCPETKKIASLLQEFRKRQTHMAVIVDEYGGTSGLVTIEDILEEIVGEISDEYDDQELLFQPTTGGGWIVDARMNLLDIEEEIGIKIPQEEDYDTLAGYVFYRVGSIPQAGLVLHHDQFELEIVKSNDRMVEKVKITPALSLESRSSDESLSQGM